MPTPTLHRILITAAAATLAPFTVISSAPTAAAAGPDCEGYDTILNGQYTFISLPDQAMLTQEQCGYRFRAGQQNSHLEVTESNGGLLLHDTGTKSWKSVEAPCEPVTVAQGVAAWCPLPGDTSPTNPVLLEVWPRLGSDHVDASTVSAGVQVAALLDGGRDVFFGGAGDDYANGAFGRDKIHGGGGDDWLRSGGRADDVAGGAGDDKIVAQGGPDVVDGGPGRDSIYAGGGGDVVTSGDSEYDVANCGAGADRIVSDAGDKRPKCERVTTYVPDGGSGGDSGGDTGGGDTGGGDTGGDGTWGSGEIMYGDATTALPKKDGKTPGIGPSSPYVQEILTHDVVPMKNQAIINPVPNGYLVRAGQQNSDMTMTVVNGRLQVVDRGTAEWKWLPSECRPISVATGVGASCEIPTFFTESDPMLIEVWPRIGNDTIDTRTLSARFDISFLGDKGDDVAYLGAGDDFFNGAQEADTVYGGDGRDWLRTGLADDFIDGQGGGDELVGVDSNDTIYGGDGDDDIAGGEGADLIYAGAGNDRAGCGLGVDVAWVLRTDEAHQCETVNFY